MEQRRDVSDVAAPDIQFDGGLDAGAERREQGSGKSSRSHLILLAQENATAIDTDTDSERGKKRVQLLLRARRDAFSRVLEDGDWFEPVHILTPNDFSTDKKSKQAIRMHF